MADVVNNGNDSPAQKPGEAAGSNQTAGFQSFAEFEAQMARENEAGSATASVATQQNDAGVRPASQIADEAAKAREAEEAAAAGADDEDEDEDGDEEAAAAGAADERTAEQKAADEAAAKGPQKAGLKKRLGELVREKHETARREAEALARAEAAEERARLAEEAAARGEKPKAAKPAAGEGPARPKPEDFEFGEYDPNYQDAIVAWRVEDALAKRDAKVAQQTAEEQRRTLENERNTRWGGIIEKGASKNPDFEQKVLSGQGWKLSKQMWEMSVDSDVGHDVLYHLASNPDESARIFDLPLTRQAAEFGKLEARFTQPSPEGKSVAKDGAAGKLPKAPAPQSRVRGAGGQYKTDAGTKDFAAFEAMMKAEEAARLAAKS